MRVNWRLVSCGAAVLIVLFTIQNYLVPTVARGSQSLGRTFGVQVIVWGTWLLLSPLIFRAARRWRRDRQVTVGSTFRQARYCLGVTLLHATIASTSRWTVGWAANADLADSILATMFANLGSGVLRYWLIAAGYHAVAYLQEVRARDVRAARLEASLVQARLDSLQGRLHPHFLFNTLNSIGALIRDQPAAAEQMLGSLSDLLRASLDAEPSREVTLERELDLVRQYLSIQQTRFQDRLTVSIEASPDALGAYLPHLLLQPLVENAVRHGIAPRDAPGHLRLAAGRRGDRLRLIVEDDGIGIGAGTSGESGSGRHAGVAAGPSRNDARESSGFGLSSTRARLQHLYGAAATFDVQPRTPTGVIATVDLPYHTLPIAQADAPS